MARAAVSLKQDKCPAFWATTLEAAEAALVAAALVAAEAAAVVAL